MESRYFASLPEEDKTRLKGQLAELEKQRNEAKKTQEESVEKLFKTGSWPIAPSISMEEGVEEKHKEVVNYIQELKDTALQMSKILGDISMYKPPPLFLPDDSDDEDRTAMDVDQSAPHKSRKRRRISENLDGPGGGSAPSSVPTQEELDEFLERLAHMEGLISTLQNDINEHSREAREEFEQLVDAKLDEFQTTREEEERKRLEDEQGQIQGLDQELALVGEQVGELATEIGDLIIRMNKLEVDVVESRKERQKSFEKVLEVGCPSPCFYYYSSPTASTDLYIYIGGTTFTRIYLNARGQRPCYPNIRKGSQRLHIPTSLSTRNSTTRDTTL